MKQTNFELIMATTTAKDNEQMNNQMMLLTFEAFHILATMAYNDVKQMGLTREEAIEKFVEGVIKECEMIFSVPDEEMEIARNKDRLKIITDKPPKGSL
jgi:antitoxin component of RelBE/YafQ-DinJ toxin-antitoxin module